MKWFFYGNSLGCCQNRNLHEEFYLRGTGTRGTSLQYFVIPLGISAQIVVSSIYHSVRNLVTNNGLQYFVI